MIDILFILFTLTYQIEGGWEIISVQSKEVNSVRSYLQKNIPLLFPEIDNYEYIIESARLQIVTGMNLQLNIKILKPRFEFIITLYVNPQKEIIIKDISHKNNARPTLGGYIWHEITSKVHDDLQSLVQGTILVYRTKIERGIKTHIIFRDKEQNVYSTIFAMNPKTQNEELIFINEIE